MLHPVASVPLLSLDRENSNVSSIETIIMQQTCTLYENRDIGIQIDILVSLKKCITWIKFSFLSRHRKYKKQPSFLWKQSY